MRRSMLLLAGALALLVCAPARAAFLLHVDATTVRGHVRMFVLEDPGTQGLDIRERGRPIAGQVEPFPGGAVVRDGGVWKCSRRDRTFTATATGPDGAAEHSEFTVRTPSCANRLTLRTAPSRATVTDSFGLGGVHARLCARSCRDVALPRGRPSATVPIRGARVTLRTRYQHVRVRVGAHPSGGPVVLATGDSLMQNLDVILQDRLARRADLRSDLKLGGGLTYDALYGPWAAIARGQVARLHPRTTVVFVGTNDVYPIGDIPCCGTDWGAAYESRAREVMSIYAQGGAGHVVWLTIPLDRDARRHPAEVAVNAAVRRAAAAVPGAVVLDTDERFTPDGRYRDRIGHARVREPDGIHLSLAGARLAARLVLAELRDL